MNEREHDEPRYYLEDCQQFNGKTQWRRSQQADSPIDGISPFVPYMKVTWSPEQKDKSEPDPPPVCAWFRQGVILCSSAR